MMKTSLASALWAATAISALAAPACAAPQSAAQQAETAALRALIAAQQAQIDALTARLDSLSAKPAAAAAGEQAVARTEPPKAPVGARQDSPGAVKTASAAYTPIWRGGPEFIGQKGTSSEGFRFKLRGRLNYDVAYIENPKNAIPTKDLGFSTHVRRLRLGADGSLPGNFGYKLEIDFADQATSYADIMLTWHGKRADGSEGPLELTLGNFESLDGFEQISSARYISFLERAAFNEAFNNTRRLGAAATYISRDNLFRLSVGAFNDTINADRSNDDWIAAVRATYSPRWFGGQMHFGANFQHRAYQTNTLSFNYQARPYDRNTDTRFVSTGLVGLKSDTIVGAEFLGIWGPFHVFGEGQVLRATTLRPADVLTGGDVTLGTRFNGDPTFFGYVLEAGYFLTGESRGYRNGLLDRTKVLHPIDKGGAGTWSINARYDYLDLSDRVGAADSIAAPNFINGGKQVGYLASVIWAPIDYIRFTLQYSYGVVTGGPRQLLVNANETGLLTDRSFNYSAAAFRAHFEF